MQAVPNFNHAKRGVTLIEMLIVMAIVALVAGLSFPSVASGVDSLRLRSASNGIVSFLNTAIDRAERHQQVIEILISPRESVLEARAPGDQFVQRLDIPEPVHIVSVQPSAEVGPDEPRRFLCYPGGTVPRIGIEIANKAGRRRMVSVDPITGVPRSELEQQ
jgi:prepilin-type N-terminal cleavage/methylation domain-containing protein